MGRRPGGQTAGRDSEGLRKEAAVGIEYRSPHRVRVTQRRPIAGGAPRQPKERPSQTNAASLPPAERVVPLAGGTWCHSSPRSHWAHVSNKKSREREEPKEHPKVGPHDDQSALLACGQCWQAGGAGCGPEAGVVPSFLTNSAGGRRREGRPGQTTARAGSKQLEPTPPQQPPLPPPPRWQRVCAPPTSSVHADIFRARAGWGGRAAAAPAMQARLTTTKKRQQKSLGHGRRR